MKKFVLTIYEDEKGQITATSENSEISEINILASLQIAVVQMANKILNPDESKD
jgi:hypothetical protein